MKLTQTRRPLLSRLIPHLVLLGWVTLLHFSFGYGVKFFYVVVMYLIMRLVISVSPLLYRVGLIVFTLLGMAYMSVGILYGEPDANVVASVLYTHPEESYEYLTGLPGYVLVLSITVLVLGILSGVYPTGLRLSTRKKQGLILLFCLISTLWSPIKKGELLEGKLVLPAYRFTKDLWVAYTEASRDRKIWVNIIDQQEKWEPIVLDRQRDVYVMVIGESVRRDYVHAFGYPRYPAGYTNTPWLDRAPATLYTNYLSAGASTVPSLTAMLSVRNGTARELNNSIITLANKAGMETWWLSNQGQKGLHDSPIALIGRRATHTTFLKSKGYDEKGERLFLDRRLLVPFNNALQAHTTKPKLIVLHLMGSHSKACERTQAEIDIDMGSKEISCYVKSIANTDYLLNLVADSLRQQKGSWSILYFADHGVTYLDKDTPKAQFVHSDKTRENYEVPFFVMHSESTQQSTIDTVQSGLDFLHFFANWISVDDNTLPPTGTLHPQVLDNKGNLTNFDTLPSVP